MVIDAHNHIGVDWGSYLRGDFPYAQSLEDLRAKAAETPISHWLVFPFVGYPTAEGRPNAFQPPVNVPDAGIPYGLANRFLLREISNFQNAGNGTFLPIAIVDPLREVSAQVAHLRNLREQGRFFALKIQATIIQAPVLALLKEGGALLDLAAEWDVPFLIHSSIHPDDVWSQVGDILQVAEARPDIRFILAHSCRFHRASLDRVAELPNTWFDCSAHGIHCQLAVSESPVVATRADRVPTDYRDPAAVLQTLAEAYPKRLIWGTDSPYYSWVAYSGELQERLVSSYRDEWSFVAPLSPSVRRAITETNTLKWLGLHENDLPTE